MINIKENIDLSGYTALIPSIGVGNVAQLSVDLIIATLQLKRVGDVWHPALMSIFGPPAYQHDSKNKTVSCELYADEKQKLLVFQIRSPLVTASVQDFLHQLTQFLKDKKFAQVFILSSSHAYEKHTVEATPFEYISNGLSKNINKDVLSKSSWVEFQGAVVHGGGFAQKLLKICTDLEIPTIILFKWVSEGDNSPDASQLVGQFNQIHKIFNDVNGQVKLTVPVSWNLLFGNDPPELIF